MDDSEIDCEGHYNDIFPPADNGLELDNSLFDEMFKACTHTHSCNPVGPDNTHTHTCFHVHTKIVPANANNHNDLKDNGDDNDMVNTTDDTTAESVDMPAVKSRKKRPSGNREAVRKYREKKKARAESLEDEVIHLRAYVQHLNLMLQGKAALEAENARLKSLLVDIRGRIEGEIGTFPYKKPVPNTVPQTMAAGRNDGKIGDSGVVMMPASVANFTGGGYSVLNSCNMYCEDEVPCFQPANLRNNGGEMDFLPCEFGPPNCPSLGGVGVTPIVGKEFMECGSGSVMQSGGSSNVKKRKGSCGNSVKV